MDIQITQKEFELFRTFIYQKAGISLSDKKKTLVQGRLSKRIRKLGLSSFREYYDIVVDDRSGEELTLLIDAISTNVTSFFREQGQWEYLKENLQEILRGKKDKRLRIWSAACSSGEEPYSIIMFLRENMNDFDSWDIKILATDISNQILSKAQRGEYEEKHIDGLPRQIMLKYFDKSSSKDRGNVYKIKKYLRDKILFRTFNLIYGDFNIFRSKFDIIFCRNVMIYFDATSQKKLVSEYAKLLNRGSLLFIGHSESLTRNKEEFKLIRSSIYERI